MPNERTKVMLVGHQFNLATPNQTNHTKNAYGLSLLYVGSRSYLWTTTSKDLTHCYCQIFNRTLSVADER